MKAIPSDLQSWQSGRFFCFACFFAITFFWPALPATAQGDHGAISQWSLVDNPHGVTHSGAPHFLADWEVLRMDRKGGHVRVRLWPKGKPQCKATGDFTWDFSIDVGSIRQDEVIQTQIAADVRAGAGCKPPLDPKFKVHVMSGVMWDKPLGGEISQKGKDLISFASRDDQYRRVSLGGYAPVKAAEIKLLVRDRTSIGYEQDAEDGGFFLEMSWRGNTYNVFYKYAAGGTPTGGDPPEGPSGSLQLEGYLFSPGERITVFFEAPASFPSNAWVGMFHSNVEHGDEVLNDQYELAFEYIRNRTKGSFTFTAPSDPGSYDFRMFDSDDGGQEVTFVSFSVEENTGGGSTDPPLVVPPDGNGGGVIPTFQNPCFSKFPGGSLPGFNMKVLTVDLETCLQQCEENDWCLSADYDYRSTKCYLQNAYATNRSELASGGFIDHYRNICRTEKQQEPDNPPPVLPPRDQGPEVNGDPTNCGPPELFGRHEWVNISRQACLARAREAFRSAGLSITNEESDWIYGQSATGSSYIRCICTIEGIQPDEETLVGVATAFPANQPGVARPLADFLRGYMVNPQTAGSPPDLRPPAGIRNGGFSPGGQGNNPNGTLGHICNDPRVLPLIDRYLSQAIPTKKIYGKTARYDKWARVVDGNKVKGIGDVDTGGIPRCEWLWGYASEINSTNLGTMKEFVLKNL